MRRIEGPHIRGPYKEKSGKWRIIIVEGGRQSARIYSQKGHAKRAMAGIQAKLLQSLALGPQVQRWCDAMTARGLAASTVAYRRAFLLSMFDGECAAMWSRSRVERTLQLWAGLFSVATRRLYLWLARSFWVATQTGPNPWLAIKIEGRQMRGKPQLRVDEAKRLIEVCMKAYRTGEKVAAAFPIMLGLGLRSSEICKRQCRDVDDNSTLLWIPDGKTVNARRTLEIPPELRPLFDDLTQGQVPDALLLGHNSAGKPWRSGALWQLLGWYCKRAGIPRVCPHSLRGLWASLSLRNGLAPASVAAALGHSSFDITLRHYIAPGVGESAQARIATSRLFHEQSETRHPAPPEN